jgi:hypothetical protein
MSDYLNNLAAKSLNPAEVVQPRLTSLFEPPPVSGWLDSGRSPGLEKVEDEPASGETGLNVPSSPEQTTGHPPESRPSVADLSPSSNTGQQPGELSAIPELRPEKPIGHPQSLRTPAELQPADHSMSEQSGQSVAIRPSAEPAPQKQRPTGQQPLQPGEDSLPVKARSVQSLEPPAPSPERPTSSAIPGPLVQPGTPLQFTENALQHPALERLGSLLTTGEQQPTLQPLIQEIVVERMVSPAASPPTDASSVKSESALSLISTAERESQTAPEQDIRGPEPSPVAATSARVVAQPHVTQYVEPAGLIPIGPVPRPEPAPTIQVTIGRVEVRAMPPTPRPSEKQRPKTPVMSLDEYLSRRASGGDR